MKTIKVHGIPVPIKTQHQEKRLTSFLIDNSVPRKIRCYDNGGQTADRYTVVFTGGYRKKTSGSFWYLGMSCAPFHPQGIGMHGESDVQIDRPAYSHLGKKIQFGQMTADAQVAAMQTYLYLWDFIDWP